MEDAFGMAKPFLLYLRKNELNPLSPLQENQRGRKRQDFITELHRGVFTEAMRNIEDAYGMAESFLLR